MVSIFLVEDEISILRLYQVILESYGYNIVGTAKNGEDAVNQFKEFNKKPDIIIMDHRMPIKNGIEATKEILALDKNAKIIFASADKSVEDLAMEIGAVSFKLKPFDIEILIENIQKVLKSSQKFNNSII